jgi:5'-methylthioadenosine phosphorylase
LFSILKVHVFSSLCKKLLKILVKKMVVVLTNVSDVKIGIIGGSGLYSLDGMTILGEIRPTTPWGLPSDAIVIGQTDNGTKVAFLARHGRGHHLTPSQVPSRANIAALKSIGVAVIIAFSAVGSLRTDIHPTDFILPSQIIDRTKGIRDSTYFDSGVVGHVIFADPFSAELADIVDEVQESIQGPRPRFHRHKTVVCMEGPQFSTRAESHMYRSWGGDIINMSVLPESKLAREAEIPYQMVCMSTDYDSWRDVDEVVSVEMVMKTMEDNSRFAKLLARELIPVLADKLESNSLQCVGQLANSSCSSIMTAVDKRDPETMKKLSFLLPGLKYNN